MYLFQTHHPELSTDYNNCNIGLYPQLYKHFYHIANGVVRLNDSPVMRGRFGPFLSPGLCRLDTSSATAHTLCTPPGVHRG